MFVPEQTRCRPACARNPALDAALLGLKQRSPDVVPGLSSAAVSAASQAELGACVELATASLHAIDLLRGASLAAIAAATSSARMQYIERDRRIFEQGSLATHAFAVVSGSLRIIQTGPDGGQIICGFATSGQSFGIAATFNAERRCGDAVAAQSCVLASWDKAQLLDLIANDVQIAVNLISSMGHDLAESHNRIRELATQCCDQRIAHTLLRLAGQAGLACNGKLAISIPLRRRDIADAAGTTLHTASRVLSGWEKSGLLVSHEQQLMIQDLAALERIANGLDA